MKANWTKKFLEEQGFSFILTSFLGKELSSSDAVTFSEQASVKDLAFRVTLLRVFLQAGFNSQEQGIGQAISLVRKSSQIDEGNDDAVNRNSEEDGLLRLMGSPKGQDIMQNTNFEALFDKIL